MMIILSFTNNVVKLANFTESVELTDTFDISKIYHLPVQQDLAGNLECPKIIEIIKDYDEIRLVIDCDNCNGVGYYDGQDKIVTCRECNGKGEIDISGDEEDYTSTNIKSVDVEYQGIKARMDYNLGQFVFGLQDKPCSYKTNYIIIDEKSKRRLINEHI